MQTNEQRVGVTPNNYCALGSEDIIEQRHVIVSEECFFRENNESVPGGG